MLKKLTDQQLLDEAKRRGLTLTKTLDNLTKNELEAELRSMGVDPEKIKLGNT